MQVWLSSLPQSDWQLLQYAAKNQTEIQRLYFHLAHAQKKQQQKETGGLKHRDVIQVSVVRKIDTVLPLYTNETHLV